MVTHSGCAKMSGTSTQHLPHSIAVSSQCALPCVNQVPRQEMGNMSTESYLCLDVHVGLQHVLNQDPDSVSMALFGSPMQPKTLLCILGTNVAAQRQQL